MQFEIICGNTQAKLNEEVEKKIAEGWKKFTGEVHIIESDWTGSNIEVPKFLSFAQSIIKEDQDISLRSLPTFTVR